MSDQTTHELAHVDATRFGKDHWSLLAYLETLSVDAGRPCGEIDRRRLRCNPERHPQHAHSGGFKPQYSTRLAGYFDFPDRQDHQKAFDAGYMIEGHDDWDCLDDLEANGFIHVNSHINGLFTMSRAGQNTALALRAHKMNGGTFASFTYPEAS